MLALNKHGDVATGVQCIVTGTQYVATGRCFILPQGTIYNQNITKGVQHIHARAEYITTRTQYLATGVQYIAHICAIYRHMGCHMSRLGRNISLQRHAPPDADHQRHMTSRHTRKSQVGDGPDVYGLFPGRPRTRM